MKNVDIKRKKTKEGDGIQSIKDEEIQMKTERKIVMSGNQQLQTMRIK